MLLFVYLVLPATAYHLQPIKENRPTVSLLLQATSAVVISKEFGDHAYTVFVSWDSSTEQSGWYLSDLINPVLQTLHGQLVIEVTHRVAVITRRPRVYNIFIVDSLLGFEKIYATICPKLYNFAGQILVVVLGDTNSNEQHIVSRILEMMWRYYVVNVNVIFASSGSDQTLMYTYFPFSEQHCEHVSPNIWNVFTDNRFIRSCNHYPPKLNNLYGCPLTAALYSYGAFMQLQHGSRGEIVGADGIDARLLEHLSETLNFTVVPREVPNELRFGLIYENGSATGAMQMVKEGEANFTLGFFGYNMLRHKYMSLSQNYHFSQLVMVVSPGEEYEPCEMLLLPFSNTLWFAFFGCVACGLLVIFTIERMSASIKNFVFGCHVRTPYLNLLTILFGGSLVKLPGRNFARFILTLWVIYSLIIRTVYQQAMFNFLQLSPNKSTPSTLTQLVEGKYPIYLIPSEVYVFDNMPDLKPQIKIIANADMQMYNDAIRHGLIRGTRISNYELTLFDNSKLSDGRYFRMLRERLANYQLCVGLRINSCLTKPFDDVILQLNPNGLVQAWVYTFVNKKYATIQESIGERKQLTVWQLLGAFQVWITLLVCCTVVFAIEVVLGYFSKDITLTLNN